VLEQAVSRERSRADAAERRAYRAVDLTAELRDRLDAAEQAADQARAQARAGLDEAEALRQAERVPEWPAAVWHGRGGRGAGDSCRSLRRGQVVMEMIA
jgi:hypothetical protein